MKSKNGFLLVLSSEVPRVDRPFCDVERQAGVVGEGNSDKGLRSISKYPLIM